MSEDAHIIEIDGLVLDGIDPRSTGLRQLIETETRRALLRAGLPDTQGVAGSEAAVAREVARSVDHAIKGGRGDA